VPDCDIAIYGGGIAGLWTLARLRAAGYRCILIEHTALGAGQTIASQGIIHGGIKYALTGSASDASREIAGMPAIWRACLEGSSPSGHPDLRAVTVLSQRQHLWTAGGVAARIAGAAASRVIRTEVRRLDAAERPDWLDAARGLGGIDVYTVEEPVLDPGSLLRCLAAASAGCITTAAAAANIRPRVRILTAGAGNEDLVRQFTGERSANDAAPRMQRRPLHMVMARAATAGHWPLIYGHCISASPTPRLTVTSQRDAAGRTVLYLGGALAEEGVSRSPQEQIAAARAELRACLPRLDLTGAQFATLRIDRAEAATPTGARPDGPIIAPVPTPPDQPRTLAVWPTKLAFAPLVADRLLETIRQGGVEPSGDAPLPGAVAPPVTPLPWDAPDLNWT